MIRIFTTDFSVLDMGPLFLLQLTSCFHYNVCINTSYFYHKIYVFCLMSFSIKKSPCTLTGALYDSIQWKSLTVLSYQMNYFHMKRFNWYIQEPSFDCSHSLSCPHHSHTNIHKHTHSSSPSSSVRLQNLSVTPHNSE